MKKINLRMKTLQDRAPSSDHWLGVKYPMSLVETIQERCTERLQQPFVDVSMSNDASRPATIGICKGEFGENFKDPREEIPRRPESKRKAKSSTACPDLREEIPRRPDSKRKARVSTARLVLLSTTNRRLLGRMVHEEAQIYLALPYIAAAASALTVCVLRFM